MNAVDLLTAEISRQHGLRAQEEWRPAVLAALEAVGAEPNAAGLLDAAAQRRAMTEALRRITVPETHFFRNAAQLDAAAAHVADIWSREKRRAHVWCAGSASGEEPYTLAMLMHRASGPHLSERVSISGSDLNSDVVERARRAVYTAWSFRGAPGWCLPYFERIGKGELVLSMREIRDAVEFTVESCQAGALRHAAESLDVVCFRNVAIYLELDAIQELHRAFARILRPGGLFLLGPSDPRPGAEDFEFVGYRDHAPVFRRRSAQVTVSLGDALLDLISGAEPIVRGAGGEPRSMARTASTVPPPVPLCDTTLADDEALDPPTQLRRLGLSHMEKGDVDAAVAAFRQALFLDPRDLLARYFYALALKEAADDALALRQLETLERELAERARDEKLSDRSTRVEELRVSAAFMRSQWQ